MTDPDITFDEHGKPVAPWAGVLTKGKNRVKEAFIIDCVWVASIWIVFALQFVTLGWLTNLGIHPRELSSLPGIIVSPFLHAGVGHILGNTSLGIIAVFLVALSGKRAFCESSAIILFAGGFGTWLIAGSHSNHIGASGLIYGWMAYLIVRGFFNKSLWQSALGILLAITHWYLITGFVPQGVVSWQGHLCGAVAGVVAGMVITSDDPVKKT